MYVLDKTLSLLARDKLSVLLFHAVPEQSPEIYDDLKLSAFERVIDFIGERFKVISLEEAVACMRRGKLPPGSACITFDDGYASWMDGAVPLLEKRNMHATFFITTGQFQNIPMWHERVAQAVAALPGPTFHIPGFGIPSLPIQTLVERKKVFALVEQFLKYQKIEVRDKLMEQLEKAANVAPRDIKCMTTSQLVDLANRGFGIGAHTITHPILTLCGETNAAVEIGAVREELEGIVGQSIKSFAYPNGHPFTDFGPQHARMVKAAGYTHAVTTQWGAADINTPIYEIPRFTPWGPDESRMAFQLARNLITRPHFTTASKSNSSLDRFSSGSVNESATQKPPVVMFVENGAGFGGAVVALQTLLESLSAKTGTYYVVTNMPVGRFDAIESVRAAKVIPDRVTNFRNAAVAVRSAGLGPLTRVLLFLIGRLDDVFNRLPYFIRLLIHTLRLKPDIIHGNNEPNSNREAMVVAKLLSIPYVQHLRGPLGESRHTPWLLAGPQVFMPVSRWLSGELLISGVSAERIRHVYDAVQLLPAAQYEGKPSLRSELGLPEDTVLVAMIGMLVGWKGQDLFLNAVSKINQETTKVAYLIIGGTPERGNLEYADSLHQQCREMGLSEVVYFLGKRNDMAWIFEQLDIAVSASTEPEPLGLVMLEAMSKGCIFVAPAFGAATEVIENGVNGYLFEPRSADSLAKQLQVSIASLGSNQKMVQSARMTVTNEFSQSQCVEETSRVHIGLLG